MRGYFKQFGRVTRLRVSRNKKTGAAKHYAFVEFQSAEVADIVARTMNNYLMFGHILQCRVVPTAQVNPKLFDGANTRFKIDPRNKKEGAAMEHGAERAVWEKRINNAQKKRDLRNKGLQDEMDYEFTGPAMKAVADVPKNASTATLDDGAAQQLLAEASAANNTDAVQQSESKPEHSSVPETTVKAKAKKPRKPTKATVDAPVEKTDADAGPKAATEKAEDVVKVAADALSGVQPKKSKKGPKAKKNTQAPVEGILENIEAAAKSGAETIVDAASAAVDKVESVIDAAVEAIVPEIEETVPENKTKKPRNRKAKANGTSIAEPVVEEVDPAKVVVDEVEEKAEVVQEKKGKGKKAKKAKIATEAIAEQIEEAATVPEAAVEAEPVKEKKGKKAKKTKVDAVPEVQEEAPVQSIVGDVIDAAKKTTKKVKAAKKAKPELVVEADDAPMQSIVGDVVDKAEVSTKKVKKAKKAKASVA
jgi:nucleolar protein 15